MKKLLLLTFLIGTMIKTALNAQNQDFQWLKVISIDYFLETKHIDTSVYKNNEPMPITSLAMWDVIGKEITPVSYIKFIPDRKLEKDSIVSKIKKNKGVIKRYVYNEITQEWFLHLKTKRTIFRKVRHWITFYHEYHKMYFTTRTDFKFDRINRLEYERTVDLYSRKVKNETFYQYR